MEHFRVVKVVQPAMASLGVLLPHTTPGLARSQGLVKIISTCARTQDLLERRASFGKRFPKSGKFEGTRKQVDPKLFINGSPWSPVGPGWGKIAVPDWSIGQMELDSQKVESWKGEVGSSGRDNEISSRHVSE
ncbi:hypothetical protein PCH_Pc16g01780 [Penicillium rubens Wisconsin 54-1255]|uniref:Uncharacterized protein n=1 Tax=Penicillium rubens (strain ATCC 28089 / DSM 1075 / NRRL 1951 / Wisconsin 54-1255) TaxID=500485 RepID=B6H756_PENRW|nr:hypothetical protein PCH_Pc16g01780 [Penicillium rubens Wisconsin 54-1255]